MIGFSTEDIILGIGSCIVNGCMRTRRPTGINGVNQGSILHVAVSVQLQLIPVVLVHILQLAQGSAVADFLQVNNLAVHDGLADPSPLVVSLAVGLTLHVVAVDIGIGLGRAVVLTDNHSGNDVAVVLVQSIDLAGGGLSVILIGARRRVFILVCNNQAHVLGAGGNAVHIVNDQAVVLICSVFTSGGLDSLGLNVDVDSVIVAVDLTVVGGVVQRDILSVNLDLSARGILNGLSNLGALLGELGENFLQGVHAGAVHAVGAPGVDLGEVTRSAVAVCPVAALLVLGLTADVHNRGALGKVHGDGLHGAVHVNDVSVSVPGGQGAVLAVNTGEEHVLVRILILLNADQVAIGIKDHIEGGVLQVGVAVLLQDLVVILRGVGILIGLALHGDVLALLEAVDGSVGHHLGSGHGLHLAVSHGDQEHVVLLHGGDINVLVLHGDRSAVDIAGLALGNGVLDVVGVLGGVLTGYIQREDIQINLAVLAVIVLAGDGQIGVDDDNLHIIGGLAGTLDAGNEHLGQNTLLGAAHAVVVGALDLVNSEDLVDTGAGLAVNRALGLTVDVDGDHLVLQMLHHVLGDGIVQVLTGDLGGELSH